MKWNYDRKGGTAGTYTLNGWKVFCNGDQWIIDNPKGHRYERNYKSVVTAKKFAERKMKNAVVA